MKERFIGEIVDNNGKRIEIMMDRRCYRYIMNGEGPEGIDDLMGTFLLYGEESGLYDGASESEKQGGSLIISDLGFKILCDVVVGKNEATIVIKRLFEPQWRLREERDAKNKIVSLRTA